VNLSKASTHKFLKILAIFFAVLFSLFPIIFMFTVSLSKSPDFLATGKFTPTLLNYKEILSNRSFHFLDYLRNSFIVATAASIIATSFGTLAAYPLARTSFPHRETLAVLMLSLTMFPQISVVGYVYRMTSRLSLINTYPGLIFPHAAWSTALAVWMMWNYFKKIPIELDKAALVDGASYLKILFKVVLPLSLPALASTFLLVFLFSFNEFLFALMLTTDYKAQTIPVGIAMFQGLHGELPWGYIMAASALAALPVMLIAILTQKYIVEGLTAGAVKS